MPTYAYECEKCGHKFERFQGMNDPHVKRCPECKGKVRRLVGAGAGIILKGSGFYARRSGSGRFGPYLATDYKREGPRTRCGSGSTCCGRETPCDSPPCDE